MIGFIFWIIPIIIFWIKTDQIIKAIKENTSKIAETNVVLHANRKNVANKLRKIDFQKKTFQMVFKSQIKRLFSFIFFRDF